MDRYTDALTYIKNQRDHYARLINIAFIIRIIAMIGALFVSFSAVCYSFTNDSLTSMQLLKWSLSKYWYMYVILICQYFIPVKDLYRKRQDFEYRYYMLLKEKKESENERTDSTRV